MSEDEKENYRREQKMKTDELWTKLEEGIREIYESDRYKDYLDMASKMYRYSPNNQILILMQKPDASLVQSVKAWNRMEIRGKEYHRSVNKGEKGIRILVPLLKEVEVTDKKGKPVLDRNGDPIKRKLPYRFKIGHVFDISQTSGDELPDPGDFCTVLTGDVEDFQSYQEAIENTCPFPVSYEETESIDVKGYCDYKNRKVVIRPDLSQAQTLKTLIHETAHARFHEPRGKENPVTRSDMEIQAESIAYIVSNHFGLDTSDYSFGYVAGWSSEKGMEELRANMTAIQEGAEEMIQNIQDWLDLNKELEMIYSTKKETQKETLQEKASTLNTFKGIELSKPDTKRNHKQECPEK